MGVALDSSPVFFNDEEDSTPKTHSGDFTNAKPIADIVQEEELPWWSDAAKVKEETKVDFPTQRRRRTWRKSPGGRKLGRSKRKRRYPQNYTAGRKEVPQEQEMRKKMRK